MPEQFRNCQRPGCLCVYDWRKSSSRFLKLTFCSYTCERSTNGFLIEDFDYVTRDTWKRDVIRERLYGTPLAEVV